MQELKSEKIAREIAKPVFGAVAGITSTLAVLNATLPPSPVNPEHGLAAQSVHFCRSRHPLVLLGTTVLALHGLAGAYFGGSKQDKKI